MITVRVKGKYKKVTSWLERLGNATRLGILDKYGRLGVKALAAATPVRTGVTAESWHYDIERRDGSVKVVWSNDNVQNGFNVAIGLQYGHGTGNGGYVVGIDYINPALKPVFDKLAESMWKEIISL